MAFTAADVKTLREMTNVGMMDCKKALMATDGDMDKAVDWLREQGLAKAAKKAGRISAEGVAYAAVFGNVGVAIEVNAETDFASKTPAFLDLVKNLAECVAINDPADVDALKACTYPNSNLTVTEIMQEKVMSIGENLQIRRFTRFAANTSVAYVHAGGTHGVLVNLAVEGDIDVTEIGKNVAMQIAAFYKENCLLQQDFVRSDLFQGSVEGYIADAAKKLGGTVKFVDAIHYIKGEGIEKKQENFAAEVAAQMNMGK